MATNQEVSQRLKNLIDILPPVRVIDADTVADKEGPVRFKGLNAPEVDIKKLIGVVSFIKIYMNAYGLKLVMIMYIVLERKDTMVVI